jgi:uncharacterized protein (TIGR02246 family)
MMSEEQADLILDLTQQWFADERRRDLEASLSYLAPDVVLQPEGAPQMQGMEAARALWEGFFALPWVDLVVEPRSVTVSQSGDMAYDVGEWSMVMEDEAGRVEQQAKSLIVWENRDGEWKVVALTFSMNAGPEESE